MLETSLRMFAPVMPYICEEINQMFNKESIFADAFPEYVEKQQGRDYVINGLVCKSAVEINYRSVGIVLNG